MGWPEIDRSHESVRLQSATVEKPGRSDTLPGLRPMPFSGGLPEDVRAILAGIRVTRLNRNRNRNRNQKSIKRQQRR
jgi:hypothetical protein